MPRYFYVSTSKEGETRKGTLEAENEKELAKALRNKGELLISASLEKSKKKLNFSIGGVSLKEKLFFTRNLALMIRAGISLPKALGIISLQAESPKFKDILIEIKERITKGKKLSESLKEYPSTFSDLFCNMIETGEETGNLEEVLKDLTKQMEKTYELKSKVKSAMMYPAVILVAMTGIGILMLVMVVPQLSQTFEDLGIELPLTTRIILLLADIVVIYWYLFLVLFAVLALVFRKVIKSRGKSKLIDKVLLKVPVVSAIIKKTNIAYTARTLSALINSGVPIVRSLEIISGSLSNYYFKEAMVSASKEVSKGKKLSEVLRSFPEVYPVTFSEMIAIGEETGETSSILEKIADFSEDEVTNITDNLSSIIEPVLMIIIGSAIGFFAVSMIQPMYSMLEGI